MSCLVCHLGQTAGVSSLSSGCGPLPCLRPVSVRVVAWMRRRHAAWCLSVYDPAAHLCLPSCPAKPCLQALAGGELAYLAYSPQGSTHTQTCSQHTRNQMLTQLPTCNWRCVMTNDKAALNHRYTKFDLSPVTLSKKLLIQKPVINQLPSITHICCTLSLPLTFPGPNIHHYTLPFHWHMGKHKHFTSSPCLCCPGHRHAHFSSWNDSSSITWYVLICCQGICRCTAPCLSTLAAESSA